MNNKKNILIVCSWLDVKSSIGVFFWEQAKLFAEDYNIKLCVFKQVPFGRKKFLTKYKKVKITKTETPNLLEAYIVEYPSVQLFNYQFSNYFFKKSIQLFIEFLIETEKFKPNLIHAQSIFNAGFVAYHMKSMFKIPYIFTEHNQFHLRDINRKEILILQEVFKNTEYKLVVSLDKIRQFFANGFFFEFKNIGNFVDEKLFYPLISSKKVIGDFKIVTIGAFHPLKNQETIFKSLKLIDNQINQIISFLWIGYGAWKNFNKTKLNELLEAYRFKNIKIKLIENCSRLEVSNSLRESDLFLFSSISEGMPVSVLEALASGIPVCSTNCGGVDEIINETNGKIVKLFDFKEIAKFSMKVINKEIDFNKIKISEDIISEYGSSAFKRKLDDIYQTAIQ